MALATASAKIYLRRDFFRYLSLNNVFLHVIFLLYQLSFIWNIFNGYLLCAKHCSRYFGYNREPKRQRYLPLWPLQFSEVWSKDQECQHHLEACKKYRTWVLPRPLNHVLLFNKILRLLKCMFKFKKYSSHVPVLYFILFLHFKWHTYLTVIFIWWNPVGSTRWQAVGSQGLWGKDGRDGKCQWQTSSVIQLCQGTDFAFQLCPIRLLPSGQGNWTLPEKVANTCEFFIFCLSFIISNIFSLSRLKNYYHKNI